MRLRWLAALQAMVICLAGFVAQARAPAIPKDVDKFTTYMAERFTEAIPDAKITVVGQLTLNATVAGKPSQVRLNNVWDFCERDRRNCRKQIDDFLIHMSGTVREADAEIKASDLRVVVRGDAYIADLKHAMAANPKFAGIYRHIAGDLWMICVVDHPNGVATLNKTEIAKLGLTEEQALALGIKNVAAALPSLDAETHVVKRMGLKIATGDFYDSSRMLLHESWADMSKAMGGHLVVAVPSSDVLIYGNGGGNGDRAVLAGFVQMAVEKAPKPISATLFEWTPTGWDVVKP